MCGQTLCICSWPPQMWACQQMPGHPTVQHGKHHRVFPRHIFWIWCRLWLWPRPPRSNHKQLWIAFLCQDKLDMLFNWHVHFIGTYNDDKIIIFHGHQTTCWLMQWLTTFQWKVNDILQTKDIQFMMEIWSMGADTGPFSHTLGLDNFILSQ